MPLATKLLEKESKREALEIGILRQRNFKAARSCEAEVRISSRGGGAGSKPRCIRVRHPPNRGNHVHTLILREHGLGLELRDIRIIADGHVQFTVLRGLLEEGD